MFRFCLVWWYEQVCFALEQETTATTTTFLLVGGLVGADEVPDEGEALRDTEGEHCDRCCVVVLCVGFVLLDCVCGMIFCFIFLARFYCVSGARADWGGE